MGTSSPESRLHIDDPSTDAVTITTDWKLTMQHYNSSYGTHAKRPFLQKGWDNSNGDFMYLSSTGERNNDEQGAIMMTQSEGIKIGTGSNAGTSITSEWARFENGNLGIGEDSPPYPLHIETSTASRAAYIRNNSSSSFSSAVVTEEQILFEDFFKH